jgi:hypothetical protein
MKCACIISVRSRELNECANIDYVPFVNSSCVQVIVIRRQKLGLSDVAIMCQKIDASNHQFVEDVFICFPDKFRCPSLNRSTEIFHHSLESWRWNYSSDAFKSNCYSGECRDQGRVNCHKCASYSKIARSYMDKKKKRCAART